MGRGKARSFDGNREKTALPKAKTVLGILVNIKEKANGWT